MNYKIRGYIRGTMMRSKAKLLEKLANEFLEESLSDYDFGTVKIADAPPGPSMGEANLGPAIQDAFFGPPSPGFGHPEFVARIGKPESNFTAATQDVTGQIVIDITVDASAKRAAFKVQASPSNKIGPIQKALEADYLAMYKKSPSAFFQAGLASGKVRPPDIHGTTNVTTM